jgi:hypothetical protein
MHSSWTITEIEDGNAVATVRGVSRSDAVAAIQRAMYGEEALPAAAKHEPVVVAERREQLAAAA